MAILPVYDFSLALNTTYLKKILQLLTQHHIAANPINYAIFYDYAAENNPALTKTVDSLLSEHKSFDCDTSLDLYAKYICNASLESFEKINHRIQKVIDQMSDSISDTRSKAEETSDSFQKKTAILNDIPGASTIKTILQEIIHETQSLALTSQNMQTQLNHANQEMMHLRLELAQAREIAITDGLTGLLNRRAFDQMLTEIVEHPESQNTCLSLLDIDHFKHINDTHGHAIGDNVIKHVVSIMKKHVRAHHHVARYGGEEFAIIMPNTSKQHALEILENIRDDIEKSRLKRKSDNTPLGIITISSGIAELRQDDDSESFIMRSDKALYQAKENGRNKIVHL